MSLARIYWIEHRTEDALAQERERASGAPRAPANVDAVFAKPDFRAACLASVELKERLNRDTEIPLQYGLLGNKRKVMEWLERFAADKDYGMIYMLKTAPEFDFLRDDADFQGLLRRIGLLSVAGGSRSS
jgi:hypothetical protein